MGLDRLTGPMARAVLSCAVGLVALGGLAGCDSDDTSGATPAAAKPSLGAEVVQLRRDVVLQRVEVTVENHGDSDVMVERIGLTVPGFDDSRAAAQGRAAPRRTRRSTCRCRTTACGARPTARRRSDRPG